MPMRVGNLMSDLKSEQKQGSSSNETRNKDNNYLLSALNSESKPIGSMLIPNVKGQSFMNKLSQAFPLTKDLSFGGP